MTLWKPVTYYEQEYKASTNGEIVDTRTNKQVIPFHRNANDNHLSVVLTKNGIQHTLGLHRVIAMTFIPNPDLLTVVHYIDFNSLNNNTDNLMWVSNRYNIALGNNRNVYIIDIYSKGSNITRTFYTKQSLLSDLDIRFATGWKFLLNYLTKEDNNRYSMSEVVYTWLKQDDLNKRHKEYISRVYSESASGNSNAKGKGKGNGKVQRWVASLNEDELSVLKDDVNKLSFRKFGKKWDHAKKNVITSLNHLTN